MCYVAMSQSVYSNAVVAIQGHGMPAAKRLPVVLAAYVCMAVGWFVFVAPSVEGARSLGRAAAIGLAYGVAIIGTFNFTLSAMLDKWSGAIMYRDLAWGISWATTSAVIYYLVQNVNRRVN